MESKSVAESVDERGVLRGPCNLCECSAYKRGDGKKCLCSHPPGKHQKLSSRQDSHLMHHCEGCKCPIADENFSFCSPGCRDKFGLQIYNDNMEQSIRELKDVLSSKAVDFIACRRSGCTNAVFCSDDGVNFDFCSPNCRDEHCLKEYNHTLRTDISRFEKVLSGLCQSQQDGQGSNHDTPIDPPQKPYQPASKSKQLEIQHRRSAGNNYGSTSELQKKEVFITSPKNTAATQSLKKKKGAERKVKFQKCDSDHGIIVFNKIWTYSNAESGIITGFLITGTKVNKNLEFFKKMQNGEVKLLDIIVKINNEDVKYVSDNASQESLDEMLSRQDSVTLDIFHPPYAVQTTEKIISIVLEKNPSHIFAIVRWDLNSLLRLSKDPGIKIQDDTTLLLADEESGQESVAATCGLRNKDKYVASVIHSNNSGDIQKNFQFIESVPSQQKLIHDFQSCNLIFSISRAEL